MHFEVLGPLRVTAGDQLVSAGSPQQQKLLALLLAAPNQTLSSERLIDEMWGEAPPASARHLVQDYVWRLRNLDEVDGDGARIEREQTGYAILVERDELDSLQLAEAVDEADQLRPHDVSAAERVLRQATAMWRGRPFGDLSDESPLLRSEASRLEELYLRARADQVDAGMELGRHQELVGELERLTEQHPYREQLWERLMLALYRSGRQAEALQAYHRLRRTMADELGIEPGAGLDELQGRILLHDPGLLWEPLPPPSNLPTRLTTFIGRSAEMAEVATILETSRLVTLTGPGGIGKTRLALEVADRITARFPDGVWWVDLAAVTDPDMVIAEVASTLGVSAQSEAPLMESVARAFARREALLVIDNCEHLAAAAAETVDAVLRRAARVHVLATSIVPLHVSGEVLWTVPAMRMPATDETSVVEVGVADAVKLLVERGAAVDPTFGLSNENAADLTDVCRRLDGVPLAIEMAAARLRVLTPAQILSSLHDSFALLTRVEQGGDARHETLQATFDWSYGLLGPETRVIFDRLSVFAGPFDLEAADAVACRGSHAAPALEAVTQVVEASMLTTIRGRARTRYRMLETLREYGSRQLTARGDEDETCEAHAEFFLGLAEEAAGEIATPGFASWVSRLEDAYEDLRGALAWSLARHPRERTLRVALTLYHFWFRTGNVREVDRWSGSMLQGAEQAPGPLLAAAHLCASFGATIRGSQEEPETHIDEALRLYRESGDRPGIVTALYGKGSVALRIGDFETISKCSEEALALCDEIGDRWRRADHLAILAFVHMFGNGSLDDARRLAEEALALYRELDDVGSRVVMDPLSEIAIKQGHLDEAERLAADKAAFAAGTGWEATALVNLAGVLLAKDDAEGAEAALRRGLVRALDTGLENWFRIALRDLARVAVLHEDALLAAQFIGASRRNMPHYGLDPGIYESVEAACRRMLGDDTFTSAAEQGHGMDHDQLLQLASGSAS